MLHSTIPRAFLAPPGLSYLGGYYGETVHPYTSVARFVPLENAYTTISGHHHHHHHHHEFSSRELSRSVSPIPLDLSLKPLPGVESSLKINEDNSQTIQVDDEDDDEEEEDDRFIREKNYPGNLENGVLSDRHLLSPVPRPIYSHHDDGHSQEREKIKESLGSMNCYPVDVPQDYEGQKLEFTSPKSLRSIHNYQQQLLLTPHQHLQSIANAPMTPPSTPSPPQCPRRRPRDDEETPKSSTADKPNQRAKKKYARRLKFDEDTSSPVSGTVILGPDEAVVTGDIDPAFNIVEVTEEARAELAKIENRLGPYQCKLCRQLHEDAFQLAQHRCSRIAHVEYRCPECDKRFSCPANLASHRRWHKPRIPASDTGGSSTISNTGDYSCNKCDAKFSRQTALRKHLISQHPETNNNNNNNETANSVCMETTRGPLSSPKQIICTSPLGGDSQPAEMT